MREVRIEENQEGQGTPEKKPHFLLKRLPTKVWLTILIILFVLGILLAAYIYQFGFPFGPNKNKSGYGFETDKGTPSPLNGVYTTEEKARRRPIGVMIENHQGSRPQSGLDKADLVYETTVESGITRFLAFYVVSDVEEVGPVRSARAFFVDWAKETDSIYVHCGQSIPAADLLESYSSSLCVINQFSYGSYFWRDKSRYSPHNLYTTTDKLRTAAQSAGCLTENTYDSWEFKDDPRRGVRPEGQTITIDFSNQYHKVEYSYDPDNNVYLRSLAGKPHKDKDTGVQISPKVVIVQHVERSTYRDREGFSRHRITTVGTGDAQVFMDGKKIEGTWKRGGLSDRARFYDSSGKEITFTRGQIWIEVVSSGMEVTSAP